MSLDSTFVITNFLILLLAFSLTYYVQYVIDGCDVYLVPALTVFPNGTMTDRTYKRNRANSSRSQHQTFTVENQMTSANDLASCVYSYQCDCVYQIAVLSRGNEERREKQRKNSQRQTRSRPRVTSRLNVWQKSNQSARNSSTGQPSFPNLQTQTPQNSLFQFLG